MEKILCPVDLKPDTLNALEAAAHLTAAKKAELVLLHVFTKQEYDAALSAANGDLAAIDRLEQEQQASMGGLQQVLQQSIPELQCRTEIRYGSIITTILEEAKSLPSSLIVMGSHGVHDIAEAATGNHPVRVIEQAPCPVLCLPENTSLESLTKIVYGSRMKMEDAACLQQLSWLLGPVKCRIDVVYVGELQAEQQKKWQAHQELIRSYLPHERLSFYFLPRKGEVYHTLNQYVLDAGADLLVLLTHQRNYLQRLFQKSVFKEITYFSTYPVLVFLEDHLLPAAKK